MKKIHDRTKICIVICFLFVLGLVIFLCEYLLNLNNWTMENYYAAIGYKPTTNYDIIKNQNVNGTGRHQYYTDETNTEKLYVRGQIVDSDGVFLASLTENGIVFNDDSDVREAMVHVVGDRQNNISTGVLNSMSKYFSRYTTVDGSYSHEGTGNTVQITVDEYANECVLDAFGDYKGACIIYNYKTGEILSMVSTPVFDPDDIPDDILENEDYKGAFMNSCFASAFPPGSSMKTITLEAAIDTVPDLFTNTYFCGHTMIINRQELNCTGTHGNQDIKLGYANSCNCAFAIVSSQIERSALQNVVNNGVLTSSITIDDTIHTAKGNWDIMNTTDFEFAWTCNGLHHDLVNPTTMMMYLGAVANGGKSAIPTELKQVTNEAGEVIATTSTSMTDQIIKEETANTIRDMMLNNTINHSGHYMTYRFNVEIGAKTGTSDNDDGTMNGVFSGFVHEDDYPYAFFCYVDRGGYGVNRAGDIAATAVNAVCR